MIDFDLGCHSFDDSALAELKTTCEDDGDTQEPEHFVSAKALDLDSEAYQQSFDNSFILSITIQYNSKCNYSMGICICDMMNFDFKIAEIIDNEYFTLLESVLIQINPHSCLINIANDLTIFKRVDQILTTCNVKKLYQDNLMGQWNLFEKTLARLLTTPNLLTSFSKEFNSNLIQLSTYKLVTYLNLTVSPFYENKFTLSYYHLEDYMCLDRASFSALNIFSKGGLSLFNLLNNCRTSIGARRLYRWISQPLTSLDEIIRRHNIVETFAADPCFIRIIQTHFLRKVPDLDIILANMRLFDSGEVFVKRTRGLKLSFEDLYRLYQCILAGDHLLRNYLLNYVCNHRNIIEDDFIKPLCEIITKFHHYQLLIQQTIDLDQAAIGKYIINPNLHPNLFDIDNKKKSLYEEILFLKNKITNELYSEQEKASSIHYNQLEDIIKLVDCPDNIYVFRIKKRHYPALEQKMNKLGIERLRLNKNEVLFTTDTLRHICRTIAKLNTQYDVMNKEVSTKALKIASSFWILVEKLTNLVSRLDILLGFATIVAKSGGRYTRPNMVTEKTIELVQSRHPLVETTLENATFIANDVKMTKENGRVHIITGPNMGGKSTLIRQIALICCMAQIGSFVPCKSATLSVFKKVLCRVGASDIQQRGLSTFMAEMVEASSILTSADGDSLIIIDELGRGTSTFEGFGIAWGIIDYLINCESFVLCATHFHELSNLAREHSCVVNKSMGVSNLSNKLTFTYRVIDGSSNLSYGINISEIVKLPDEVIENARIKLALLEGGAETLNKALKAPDFHTFCKHLSEITSM